MSRYTILLLSALWLGAFDGAEAAEGKDAGGVILLNLDSASSTQLLLRAEGAKTSKINAGNIIGGDQNHASLRFDGRTAIAYTIASNTQGLLENFTWEGFFLSPSTNKYLGETGIADRLLSQFANDAGDWTRIAIGLVADTGGKPRLCIELEGFDGRSFGLGNTIVATDRWHHFALVHEGTPAAARLRWYLDYELTGELFLGGQSNQNTLKPPGNAPLTIGARLKKGDVVNRGFEGLIDEVRLTPQPLEPRQFLRVEGTPAAAAIAVEQAQAANQFWNDRHAWARRIIAQNGSARPPQPQSGFRDQALNAIDLFINEQLAVNTVNPAPLANDAVFFRRLSLDVRGRIPALEEVERFLADERPDKRQRAIDRMLTSDEWADAWVGYWQDVLAENPSLVFPTLNNSGPFRRWIHESFRDNKPFDRFATELILMDGLDEEGGTEGFALATQNDSPMAMRAHVVTKAFLGIDLKCARCHDSPIGEFEQRDLFEIAALLNDGTLKVPQTSVAAAGITIGGRPAEVTTSLKPEQEILAAWPKRLATEHSTAAELMPIQSGRPRAQLAALITSPYSSRFSDLAVNRIWHRFMGAGLIEPIDAWNNSPEPSHPDLLRYLSRYFVETGYDVKHLTRLILSSHCYQRIAVDRDNRSFAAQRPRRLSAEQVVDSLFVAVGKRFRSEALAVHATDPGAVDLPRPERAWQFVALPNERDRPALGMPVNQTIVDVLTAFGWSGARQQPRSERDSAVTALQPLILFNGLMSQRIVRLSDQSSITELCVETDEVDELVDKLFLTILARRANDEERRRFTELLEPGFEQRSTGKPPKPLPPLSTFQPDWRNHLEAKQTRLLLEALKEVARGEPPTERLTIDFRERVEDALWALINSPEFILIP
jgi:hypothetical protein